MMKSVLIYVLSAVIILAIIFLVVEYLSYIVQLPYTYERQSQ